MVTNKTSESQKKYDNKRWSKQKHINPLQLQRLITILQMVQRIDIQKCHHILDLGCGRGWLSVILSQIGFTSAIDLADVAISRARDMYPTVDFRSGDVFKKLPERSFFDLVVSQEVIEHVEDQPAFVNLVADLLKPGGYFIFTTPNAWTEAHRTQKEHETWGLQPVENWIGRKDIQMLLKQRFQILRIESIIIGYGSTGIFRLVNSNKLGRLLRFLNMGRMYKNLLAKCNFGLHLVVLAKRKR